LLLAAAPDEAPLLEEAALFPDDALVRLAATFFGRLRADAWPPGVVGFAFPKARDQFSEYFFVAPLYMAATIVFLPGFSSSP